MTLAPPPQRGSRPDLLAPDDIARLGGLELLTAGIVDGYLAGQHRSRRRGFSIEFAEHRPYLPGDEPRYIDWKLLARTDRLYVKQFEEETNLRAMLVVDASASMGWSGDPAHLTKLDYTARLAAALALILLRQRDAVGLVTFDAAVRDVLPARVRANQWGIVSAALASITPGATTAADAALERVVGTLRRRGLVIFLSDLLLDPAPATTALRYLRHRGHQVIVLHIADPGELALAPGPEQRFRDPEGDLAVTLAPDQWREAYRSAVDRAVHQWRAACHAAGIRYALMPTDVPFGPALARALAA